MNNPVNKFGVIAGLHPATHPASQRLLAKKMDARIKSAHDSGE
jgi:hypothetical protein